MKAEDIIRRGTITEIVGRLSSGRTSLLLACLRGCLARGAAAALVDADGAFDPESAQAAGIDVRRVLWVRCGGRRDVALRATDLLVRCPGFTVVVLDVGETPPFVSLGAAFRLKLAVRRSATSLVIVGGRHIAGASASLVLETIARGAEWVGGAPAPRRLAGARTEVRVRRAQGAAPPDAVMAWRWRAR
jgi:recombination protein RecA